MIALPHTTENIHHKSKMRSIVPGEGNLQESLIFPWPWPFDPYNLPHFQMNLQGLKSHWPMFRLVTVAVPPCPGKEHLLLDEMIAPGYKYPPAVALSEAPDDLPKAAIPYLPLSR